MQYFLVLNKHAFLYFTSFRNIKYIHSLFMIQQMWNINVVLLQQNFYKEKEKSLKIMNHAGYIIF
jgi:hypothetical protein